MIPFRHNIPHSFLLLLSLLSVSPVQSADCSRLNTLVIEGESLVSPQTVAGLQQRLSGQCIDSSLVGIVLQTLNGYLLEQGFVTSRAFVEAQDVRDGRLVIKIFPGRIDRIVEKRGMKPTPRVAMAFPDLEGRVLNLRDLENALEAIERLPSVDAEFEILPSTRPGYSSLVVATREDKRWRLQLGFNFKREDNEPEATLDFSLDNPFHINDQLVIKYNDDSLRQSHQGNEGHELSYSFPYGRYLFDFSVSDLSYKRWVAGINADYLSRGDTLGLKLGLGTKLFRDQADKVELNFSIAHKDTETYFAGERVDVSSYKTTIALLSLVHTRLSSWGRLVSTIGLHQGLDWFGAREDDYFGQESGLEDDAVLQFRKWTVDERLNMPFSAGRWSWNSQLHVQYAEDALYSSEQLAIGSLFTVRGYQAPLSGSSGYYFRNDLVRTYQEQQTDPFSLEPGRKHVSWRAGLDYGEILCRGGQNESCGVVAGAGVGFDVGSRHFRMSLRWGYPLRKTRFDAAEESRFEASITWLL